MQIYLRALVISIFALVSFSHSSPAQKKSSPNPNSVTIDSVDYSGNGCPAGSLSAAITPDAQRFIFIFSKLYAQAGPGIDSAATSQQCRIHVKLTVPKNWSYALDMVDFNGFASLDSSVSASQQTTYHMSGESPDTTAAFTWQGVFDDEYSVQDLGGSSPPYWSRCGGGKNLMVTTKVAVDNTANRAGSGILEVDDVDGVMLHLSWQRCGNQP
ncbi:MAG: DUF4360 domain-containing protein [Polyangia bacterium]